MYFATRLVTLCFPGFIIGYLWIGYDVNIWNTEHVDIFQVVMISIYIGLCCIVFVLLWLNCKEQYLMAHILPGNSWLSHGTIGYGVGIQEQCTQRIMNRYYGIIVIPQRRAVVIDCMGPDLGPIVLSYLPTDDVVNSKLPNVTIAAGVV